MRMRRMVLKKRKKQEKETERKEEKEYYYLKLLMCISQGSHNRIPQPARLKTTGFTASQAWRPEVGNPSADRATLHLKPALSLPSFLWFPGNLGVPWPVDPSL